MITVLAGGVGAARFLEGLVLVVPPEEVTVISNVADDLELYGLHVSPDIDTVVYTLAGVVDPERGWGLLHDSFHFLAAVERHGRETWFRLGDRDLATHVHRTLLLREGATLAEATARIARAWGLRCTILPVTNDPLRTRLVTTAGELEFQEYFVRRRAQDDVLKIDFTGAAEATPAPGVLEAITEAQGVIVAPSNPLVSIGPILAVPGVREALQQTQARVAAVSPIVGGAALRGPADRMLRSLGMEVSPVQIARLYQDFLDILVFDTVDAHLLDAVAAQGVEPLVTDTVMRGRREKMRLARETVRVLGLALP